MTVRTKDIERIDDLMEKASRELAACRYFEAERDCLSALIRAHAAGDYDRMARILLPLQECRRQKRDLAFDAGKVHLVTEAPPMGRDLKPGCYLVAPPRVGVDGRALREAADRKKVPVIVVVREPTTREGLWPIVALGPVTIRTRVKPPRPVKAPKGRQQSGDAISPSTVEGEPVPPPEWMLEANEALGDAAIASVPEKAPPEVRVQALMDRIMAHPDHEKLHQALEDACREAARSGRGKPDPRRLGEWFGEEDDEEDAEGDGEE